MTSNPFNSQGVLTVISGPSGVGKTTIAKEVKERLNATFSVSATTRPKTDQETDGVDYHFLSDEAFESTIESGGFLEHACVFSKHSYGTPREPVEAALAEGKLVILEIDLQGGLQIRQTMPDALLIFIKPPSEDVLLTRLRGRGRDDEQAIQSRYAEARSEIEKAESSNAYDAFVINDELEAAILETCDIIRRRGNIG